MEVKQEISKIIDALPESVLVDVLNLIAVYVVLGVGLNSLSFFVKKSA